MLSEPYPDALVIRYLLGDEIDDAAERSFENRLATDSDFQESVLALEDELMAAYLKGELSGRERKLFEQRFLIIERRNRRFQFLRSLLGPASKASMGAVRQSLRVFLCGTYEDLSDERKGVLECLRRMKLEHDSMELFGARSDRPIETCLREVAMSDVIVAIVGYRYGTVVVDLGISFTEAEYREAIRLGKPCLVYVRDESTPLPPRFMESDPHKLSLLQRFRSTLFERHTVATFKDPADLTVRVNVDLSELMRSMVEAGRTQPSSAHRAWAHVGGLDVEKLIKAALSEGIAEAELISVLRRAVTSHLLATGRRLPMVYLCHADSEAGLALGVKEKLANEGIAVWEPKERARGESEFVREISEGFDKADLVVALISRGLMQDTWSRREVDLIVARRMSKATNPLILPVLVEDVVPPSVLRDVRSLDATSVAQNHSCELIRDAVLQCLAEVGNTGLTSLPGRKTM